jgi:alpha/beta superfamily hydrolase
VSDVQGYSFGALAASAYSPSPTLLAQYEALNFRYILISPPVGKTAVFLIPFKFASYANATKRILETISSGSRQKALIVYGTKDQFSSASDYERYAERVTNRGDIRGLDVLPIEDADHFFGTQDARSQLTSAIHTWVGPSLKGS